MLAFNKRLMIHYEEMRKNPPPYCHAAPENPDEDMTHWIGYIDGPDGTSYADGRFYLTIDYPPEYPFKPPDVRFTTRIFHPNISEAGEICLDILHSQWSPILTTRNLLISVCSLLNDPNPDHGLNHEAINLYKTNKDKFYEKAKQWTETYAKKN